MPKVTLYPKYTMHYDNYWNYLVLIQKLGANYSIIVMDQDYAFDLCYLVQS